MDVTKVTRFEVIDHRTGELRNGRVFAIKILESEDRIEFSLQDDGRTLKVFLSDVSSGRDVP